MSMVHARSIDFVRQLPVQERRGIDHRMRVAQPTETNVRSRHPDARVAGIAAALQALPGDEQQNIEAPP
jgi:hypothetical protein